MCLLHVRLHAYFPFEISKYSCGLCFLCIPTVGLNILQMVLGIQR